MRIKHIGCVLPAAACASVVSILGVATPAQAMDFKISGQIDRAVIAADNGEDQDYGFVDNVGWNSRVRFTGSQKLANGSTVGFKYELGINKNQSTSFDINNGGGTNENSFNTRITEAFIKGDYGRFAFGRVDGSADGTSEVDYSGTAFLGGGVDQADYGAGISMLDDDGNVLVGSARGTSVYSINNEFDGLSRGNGIRYDTPSFGGFVLSGTLRNGHAYEIAGRYSVDLGGGAKFGAAADWVDSESIGRKVEPSGNVISNGGRFQEYGGSASLLLASGLNFTGSVKHRTYLDSPDDDFTTGVEGYTPSANNYYGSIGYIIGKNHVAASYGETDDLLNKDSKFEGIGLSYLYDFNKSIDLYAAYHWWKAKDVVAPDGSKKNSQPVQFLYAGIRLQFL